MQRLSAAGVDALASLFSSARWNSARGGPALGAVAGVLAVQRLSAAGVDARGVVVVEREVELGPRRLRPLLR